MVKQSFKRKSICTPPSLSELTVLILNMGLTHL